MGIPLPLPRSWEIFFGNRSSDPAQQPLLTAHIEAGDSDAPHLRDLLRRRSPRSPLLLLGSRLQHVCAPAATADGSRREGRDLAGSRSPHVAPVPGRPLPSSTVLFSVAGRRQPAPTPGLTPRSPGSARPWHPRRRLVGRKRGTGRKVCPLLLKLGGQSNTAAWPSVLHTPQLRIRVQVSRVS